MRIVLDTNVVISGTFWTGSSFKILNFVDKSKVILIVSLPILQEYDAILHSEEILEKTSIYQQSKIQVIQKILSKAMIVDPKEKVNNGRNF
ncbi:putative toxin-antitoxin system toxin component, PIN family [Candidatus Woesearchaeota archaeon]|nr:putative toxin-antitoxin system toxin component, PIN family [Candidatus Woesearchaeota archaeon]